MPVFAGVPIAERIFRLANLRQDPVNNPPLASASKALFFSPHSTSSLILEGQPCTMVSALALPIPNGPVPLSGWPLPFRPDYENCT